MRYKWLVAPDRYGTSDIRVRGRREPSIAEIICGFVPEYRDNNGWFQRDSFQHTLTYTLGGVEIWNSNDGQSIISFAPTRQYQMEDGSRVEVSYSGARVID